MKKRKTIGFFIEFIDSDYHLSILNGIIDSVENYNVNLFCFEGGILKNQNNFEFKRNIIYDLADINKLDGIIMMGDGISFLLNDKEFDDFCCKFKPLPVVSIGRSSKSISSLHIDTFNSMKKLLKHLIEVHNFKKFAFIKGAKGSEETKIRFNIFNKTLKEYSIPINPNLIYEGDFVSTSGVNAVNTWLDIIKEKFDVIVASNDNMAIGALTELKRRGIKVPEDVAVVGFDDVSKSSSIIPALTTVRQPLDKLGWKSVEMLLDLIDNKGNHKQKTFIDSTLIIRESCGCNIINHVSYKDAEVLYNTKQLTVLELKKGLYKTISKELLEAIKIIYYDTTKIGQDFLADEIINNLVESVKENDSMIFYNFWEKFLDIIFNINQEKVILNNILKILFNEAIQLSDLKNAYFINNLWRIILDMTYSKIIHIEKNTNYNLSTESWILNNIRDDININLKLEEIFKILPMKFIDFGIKSSFLSLFQNKNISISEIIQLVMAYDEFKNIDIKYPGILFPIKELVPKKLFPSKRRYSMIIEYLNYTNEPIGIILFEIAKKTSRNFSTLRRVINNILQISILYSRVEEQRNNLVLNISKLRMIMAGVIETLSMAIEIRDPYTAGHQKRVSELARTIATKMQLPSNMIEGIRMSGIVHDIGKIYVPSEILNKPGKLLDIEFELIKNHPKAGYDILKNIDFPWPIADIVYQHHEKLNGSGYPRGLSKNDILLEAKIISIADVVEAITSMRPYRPALGIDVALDEIKKYSGIYFDPDAVKACIAVFKEDNFIFKSKVI